jgi:predicted acyl esterase
VEISSSNFSRLDRNLNTGGDIFTSTDMRVAQQTVLHDQRYPSHLLVPIIPR